MKTILVAAVIFLVLGVLPTLFGIIFRILHWEHARMLLICGAGCNVAGVVLLALYGIGRLSRKGPA